MSRKSHIVDMALIEESISQFEDILPKPRGKKGQISPSLLIGALLFITQNRCPWSKLPESYGDWRVIYTKADRWARSGLLGNIFKNLAKLHPNLFKITNVKVFFDTPSSKEWIANNIKNTANNLVLIEEAKGNDYFLWHNVICVS